MHVSGSSCAQSQMVYYYSLLNANAARLHETMGAEWAQVSLQREPPEVSGGVTVFPVSTGPLECKVRTCNKFMPSGHTSITKTSSSVVWCPNPRSIRLARLLSGRCKPITWTRRGVRPPADGALCTSL